MIGRTNSAGVMPQGTINITENGTYAISSFSQAIVSVSGLVPSGTLEISSNGVYDVTNYSGASVNVQAGDFPYADFDTLIGGISTEYSGYCPSIIQSYFLMNNSIITAFNPVFSSNWEYITMCSSAFYSCTNLSSVNFFGSSIAKVLSGGGGFFGPSLYSGDVINFQPWETAASTSATLGLYYFQNANLFSTVYSGSKKLNFTNNAGVRSIYLRGQGGQLECYIHGARLQSVVLENFASIIFSGYYTFGNCSVLKTLSISNAYFIRPSYTFYEDFELEELTLDCLNLVSIYYYWFYNCYKLSSITLKYHGASYQSAVYVYSSAFYNCSALTSFPFRLSVEYRAVDAFRGAGIKSIYSNDTNFAVQTTIGTRCFYSCLSLRYISYPRAVTLSSSVFQGCINLSYVNFWGSLCSLNRIFSSAFYGCSALGSIMFGMDTSFYGGNCQIYPGAFMNCTSLSKVYIPHWSQASNIHGLQNVNAFENTPLSDSTYLGYYGSIYVPESLYSSYITATNWAAYSERFVSVTEAEMEQIIADYNNVSYVEE